MNLYKFLIPATAFLFLFVFPSQAFAARIITWTTYVSGCPILMSGPDNCVYELHAMTDDGTDLIGISATYGIDFRTGPPPGVNTYLSPASPSNSGTIDVFGTDTFLGTFQTQVNNGSGQCALNESQVIARARLDTTAAPVDISYSEHPITNIGAMVHITVLKADGSSAAGANVTISPPDGSGGSFTADSFGLVQGIHRLNCTIGHTVNVSLGSESGSLFLPAQTGTDPTTICNGTARSFTIRMSGGGPPPPPPPPSEICGNGIDDDGDGLIDEGCAPPPPPPPLSEICANGIDDDLDGFIDEGCGGIGVDIKADGSDSLTIPASGNVTLSWTTFGSPSFCVSSANWGGAIVSGSGGSQVVSVSGNTTYGITCQKPGELDTTDSVTVTIGAPPPPPPGSPTPTPSPTPPPPPIFRGQYTTVSPCIAFGEVVVETNFFYMPIPPAMTNMMQIRTGSRFGPIVATIDPWPAQVVKIAGIFSAGTTYFFQGYLIGPGGLPIYVDDPPASLTIDASIPPCPGAPVPPPPVDLEIIAAGMVDPGTGLPKTNFLPGEPARVTYTVRNPGTIPVATAVGFWPTGTTSSYGSGVLPNCPSAIGSPAFGSPGVDPIGRTFPPGNTNVSFDFNVSSTVGTYFAHAYVSFTCVPDEGPVVGLVPWGNNDVAITYRVGGGDPWFETIGGDVGSEGPFIIAGTPYCPTPATCAYTSRYLLAESLSSSTVSTERWKLNNYPGPQSTGNVYNHLAGRFKSKATSGICSVPSLLPSPAAPSPAVFNHCASSVTLSGNPSLPAGSNFVWFIDGDLTITDNFSVPANKTIIFLASGNINVENDVTVLNGIYVAGAAFTDTVGASNDGPQLNIAGAVYAGDVLLDRNCDSTCNPLTQPVERITFEPRYIDALNSILGSPTITWQEVAP